MRVYLVGGAVRDSLLGLPVLERDYVVLGASPQDMQEKGFKPVGKDFPVFLHPETQEEYALARTERKQSVGHKGFTFFTDPSLTLEDDLKRRDLTVNAIAQDDAGNLIDPYGGARDLNARILRHVSDAFAEDPLRVLRVARFAARFYHLGFTIAPETLALMTTMSEGEELQSLSAQRVWMEIAKVFKSTNPQVFFEVLEDVGALKHLMPALADIFAQDAQTKKRCLTELKTLEMHNPLFLCARLSLVFTTVAAFKVFAASVSAPKEYSDFSELVIRCFSLLQKTLNAQELLVLFGQADAWRRQERFELFLEFAHQVSPVLKERCIHIAAAFVKASAVSTEEILASGVKGRAIGQALTQARLHVIEDFLLNNPEP